MTVPTKPSGWRHWNRVLHRDLGYLAVGLTLVYAVSGLAVNHTADWDPTYRKRVDVRQVAPFDPTLPEAELVAQVRVRLELPEPQAFDQPTPSHLNLFYPQGRRVQVTLTTGQVVTEALEPRPLLHAFNRLHLNANKGIWTWIADAYAAILAFLALSGLFILRGKQGLLGRGKWWVLAGVAIPLIYWLSLGAANG